MADNSSVVANLRSWGRLSLLFELVVLAVLTPLYLTGVLSLLVVYFAVLGLVGLMMTGMALRPRGHGRLTAKASGRRSG